MLETHVCKCGRVHHGRHQACEACLIARRQGRKRTAHCSRCWSFGHTVTECHLPGGEAWSQRNREEAQNG